MKIEVRDRQCLMDIALECCGVADAAFVIAEMNDVSVSEVLEPGTVLEVPAVMERKVVDYYQRNSISPATVEEDANYLITYMEEDIITNDNDNMVENG